ncbi:MAG: hypothetical protein K6T35_10355 [Meiothermus silvanus]|nr:hypothetical protein [Allomeiothermus silvanus]
MIFRSQMHGTSSVDNFVDKAAAKRAKARADWIALGCPISWQTQKALKINVLDKKFPASQRPSRARAHEIGLSAIL